MGYFKFNFKSNVFGHVLIAMTVMCVIHLVSTANLEKSSVEMEVPTELLKTENKFHVKRQIMKLGEQLSPEMITGKKPEFYQGEILDEGEVPKDDSTTQQKDNSEDSKVEVNVTTSDTANPDDLLTLGRTFDSGITVEDEKLVVNISFNSSNEQQHITDQM